MDNDLDIRLDDLAVTQHKVLTMDAEGGKATIFHDPVPVDTGTSDFLRLVRDIDLSVASVWQDVETADGVVVKTEDSACLGDLAKSLLSKAMYAGAQPGTTKFVDLVPYATYSLGDLQQAAKDLQKAGLVVLASEMGLQQEGYQLTWETHHMVELTHHLCNPKPVLAPPKGMWSDSWYTYQCLQRLQSDGWQCTLGALFKSCASCNRCERVFELL